MGRLLDVNGWQPKPRFCSFGITEAIFGTAIGDLLFAAPEVAGAALGPASASITLDPLLVTAAAPEVAGGIGAGEVAGGAAALGGGAGLAGVGGGGVAAEGAAPVDAGAGAPDVVLPSGAFAGAPGAPVTPIPTAPQAPPFSFAADVGAPTAAPITTAPPPVTTPAPPMTTGPFTAPTATAPAAPASIGPVSPAQTGEFSAFGTIDPTAGTPFQTSLGMTPDAGAAVTAAPGTTTTGAAVPATTAGGTTTPAATATAQPSFLDRTFGAGTSSTLKDIGSIASPIASLGGLGMAIMNANRKLPGQPQLSAIPNVAGSTTLAAGDAAKAAADAAAARANAAATGVTAAGGGQIAQGQQLENYLQTGTLPPGVQAGITTAAEAAKASIRAQYAQRGMSGSSAEAQDLNAAEERAQTAGTQVALNLLAQGQTMVSAGTSELATAGQLGLSGGQLSAQTDLSTGSLDLNAEQLAQQVYTEIMNQALAKDQALGSAIGNFASSLAGTSAPGTITLKAAA